jgi:hypothetical protein
MTEMTVAMKTAKDIERSLVQSENRLAFAQQEEKRLKQANETLQAEIDKKSSDYSLFMGQKDAESKKLRADALAEREQMDKDKVEFQGMLKTFQKEKQGLEGEKMALKVEEAKLAKQKSDVRDFITAVQRACSVINL